VCGAMRAIVVVVLAAFLGFAAAQACPKYATALGLSQSVLMETVLDDVISRLVNDPVTLPWFDGRNNRASINFTSPTFSTNLAALRTSLIAFFGAALQCNASPDFTGSGKYTIAGSGVSTNMKAIHEQKTSGFAAAVTKAAYEAFNIHVLDSLRGFGVTNDDLNAIATVLDGFRGPTTGGVDTNQVCQATDCNTTPFTVHASDTSAGNYFAPSYLTLPKGGVAIRFVNDGARTHVPTEGTAVAGGACTAASGGFTSSIAPGASFTTPVVTTDTNYYCSLHCSSAAAAAQMVGSFKVSGASTLAVAFTALIAALFAILA